jgi:hypothetical protein
MDNKEHRFQCKFVKWLEANGLFVFSVPNGANISDIERINMVREGMKSGVADLVVLTKDARCVFLELKTETGKQRKAQALFQTIVEGMGFDYIIVRPHINFEELLERIENGRADTNN